MCCAKQKMVNIVDLFSAVGIEMQCSILTLLAFHQVGMRVNAFVIRKKDGSQPTTLWR